VLPLLVVVGLADYGTELYVLVKYVQPLREGARMDDHGMVINVHVFVPTQ